MPRNLNPFGCICVIDGSPVVIIIIVIQSGITPPPTPPTPPPPGNEGKVTICKVSPGNPTNRHTVQVAAAAVQVHLNTGSFLGPCP